VEGAVIGWHVSQRQIPGSKPQGNTYSKVKGQSIVTLPCPLARKSPTNSFKTLH